jgi:hypothetical protein
MNAHGWLVTRKISAVIYGNVLHTYMMTVLQQSLFMLKITHCMLNAK